MLDNIKTWCETDPNVTAICVASYIDLANKTQPQEEPLWSAGKDLFYDRVKWMTLRNIWTDTTFVNQEVTHPIIKSIKPRADQKMIIAWRDLQILYYCNYINISIQNIYLVGQAWDICLEFRSVGSSALNCLNNTNLFNPKRKILSRRDCVVTHDSEWVKEVMPPWESATDNILRLTNIGT
jgi:hypothetical protein